MTFAIITHVPHILEQNQYYAYAPYVREMNIWTKYVANVVLVAPLSNAKKTPIDSNYEHQSIDFVVIESFDILSIVGFFKTIVKIPKICWKIYSAMQKADHIHLRCPGNIGLLGCFVQILFPKKIKTAKYAGNWDPNSKQPLTYRLQKWILSNRFLTRNMQVLVYGEWEGSSKNIKPFFTATYQEVDKSPMIRRNLKEQIRFIFVGALVSGKKPIYAIQLVASLYKKGFDVDLTLYGEGIERKILEEYIIKNNLQNIISLAGNQTRETVKKAYESSHFVILPSESEGWPKAIAEAMFWGCVPVATAVSCVPFMLDYGQRGVVLEMDLERDVHQLESLLRREDDYQNKSLKAGEWSRKYTLDVFEMEVEKLIES
jgi:glycosyltransferase involved in cell wall biosynthesis